MSSREDFKLHLRGKFYKMSTEELQAYAKEHGVRLHSKVRGNIINTMVEVLTSREYHGDAFRAEPKSQGADDSKLFHEVTVTVAVKVPYNYSAEDVKKAIESTFNSGR